MRIAANGATVAENYRTHRSRVRVYTRETHDDRIRFRRDRYDRHRGCFLLLSSSSLLRVTATLQRRGVVQTGPDGFHRSHGARRGYVGSSSFCVLFITVVIFLLHRTRRNEFVFARGFDEKTPWKKKNYARARTTYRRGVRIVRNRRVLRSELYDDELYRCG